MSDTDRTCQSVNNSTPRDERLDRLALGSDCHRCGSGADDTCRTPSGKPTAPHRRRIDRAVAQYLKRNGLK